MKRLIDAQLDNWRSHPRRKPLIVRGARQVGKTHSIRELGRRAFEHLVHLDFERNPDLATVFQPNLDPKRICLDLEVITGQRLQPGASLLFLDEIQACPRALVALRYFKEQLPDLHVIAAGSLLEFSLKELSFPVGRVQFLEMFPMCFGEYLWEMGREAAAALVMGPPQPVSEAVHEALLEDLRTYLLVGGMPEAVQVFARTGSLLDSADIQAQLLESFRADFPKYAPLADKACLRAVLSSLARGVGQQIKYSRLAEGFSGPTLRRAFDLLCQSRLARKVRSTSPAGLPLEGHASETIFKALFLDVGLMQQLCGLKADLRVGTSDLLDTYRGAVAEQFVGQELLAAGSGELFYWARPQRGSSAEVDYLVSQGSKVVPVEVKSGAGGRLRSLHMLLKEYPACGRPLVFSTALPTSDATGPRHLPLYQAFGATGSYPG
jgi:predicted AAA+ superfamily ATPase